MFFALILLATVHVKHEAVKCDLYTFSRQRELTLPFKKKGDRTLDPAFLLSRRSKQQEGHRKRGMCRERGSMGEKKKGKKQERECLRTVEIARPAMSKWSTCSTSRKNQQQMVETKVEGTVGTPYSRGTFNQL